MNTPKSEVWGKRSTLIRRLFLALLGISIAGVGVAITASACLGTSPISSLPYVSTFIWHSLSFGTTTFILNSLFFFIQVVVYRKSFPKTQWFQLPAVAWFGLCIDCGMYLCRHIPIEFYWAQLLYVILGCFVLAVGIVLELAADVIFLPGEGMVATLRIFVPKVPFGTMKIIFDLVQVGSALIVSVFFLHRVEGVREGTLVAACMVGWFIKHLKFVGDFCKRTVLEENK